MSTQTPRLALPLLAASQAQKHVTHNEALMSLDRHGHLAVKDATRTSPPTLPAEGDRHVIATPSSGVWAGREGQIACFDDGGWTFLAPRDGWVVWIAAEERLCVYVSGQWRDIKVRVADRFAVNTEPNPTDRIAVAGQSALFTHEGGDTRVKINKASAGATASLVFQNGYAGRAEMGLAGDDDWRIKVSADGTSWMEGLIVRRNTGRVRFPCGVEDPTTGLRVVSFIPGAVRDIWRIEQATPTGTPRTTAVAGVSGTMLSLSTATAGDIKPINPATDFTLVRIWNTTRSPAQSAWVRWYVNPTTVEVSDAAAIADWVVGDSLRIGDPNPTGTNTLQMVAVDVSPYLAATYGGVFRQAGLKISMAAQGVGGTIRLDVSGSAGLGTAFGTSSNSDGSRQSAFADVFTDQLSPISNSNLFFIRESVETATALAAFRFMRCVGVWV